MYEYKQDRKKMTTEFTIMKIKCTKEMIGNDIIIPATEEGYEIMTKFPYAEKMATVVKYKGKHNLERHDLFYACIKLISENIGKSRIEVIEQCKLDCRWYAGYTYYKDKYGKERVNVITKSISFSAMNLKDADEFYDKAFDMLAKYLKITTEVLINEAKLKMKSKHYCIVCGKPASQKHHKYSQTKWAIEKYGKILIDSDWNLEWTCIDCHSSHAHIPADLIWEEKKFVNELEKRGLIKTQEDPEEPELDIF